MRLVSLCPSTTELLFVLGLGDRLVGVTQYCIHPAEGVAPIEKIGGTKDPDIAAITALAPDLVLLNREENRREDWQALERAGITCHLSYPCSPVEARDMVAALGDRLGVETAAAAIVDEIDAARERARIAAPANGVRIAYLIWRKPWMTVNGKTYISALLAEAGAINVFAASPRLYPEISATDLRDARPDRVLLSSEPFPFKQRHADELAEATGLEPDRFIFVDGENLSWHGSRTAAGRHEATEIVTGASR